MRELVLHIGLHKTGTSYLQSLLVANREVLSEAGLAVPPAVYKNSHHQFFRTLRDEGANAFFDAVDWGLGERQVISCEPLCTLFNRQPPLAEALAEKAARMGVRLTIVLMLRRQDHLKESVFSQVVKTWYSGSVIDDGIYDYDFNNRVLRLEDIFGREHIRVGLYPSASDASLDEVFLGLLGLDKLNLQLAAVAPANVRLHRRQTLFLSQVPKSSDEWASILLAAVQRCGAIRDDGEQYLMSPAQRAAFLSSFQAGNKALFARYGLSEPAWFTPDFGDEHTWFEPEPIQPDEYMAVTFKALEIARGR